MTLTGTASFSQQTNDTNEVYGKILHKNPFAFQFAIGNNLTLKNFGNFNISIKKHFEPGFAMRFSVGYNYSNEDLSGQVVENFDLDRTENTSNNVLYTEIDLMFYLNLRGTIKAYMGFGPYFSYYNFTRDENNNFTINNDPQSSNYRNNEVTSLGATLLLGAEWFFTNKFSLLAEYNFLYTYSWITDIENINNSSGSSSTDLSGNQSAFRGDALKFGISVYF